MRKVVVISATKGLLELGLNSFVGAKGASSTPDIPTAPNVSNIRGPKLVTVYRVEGSANARLAIGDDGLVTVVDGDRMLFLNFGSRARAEQFLIKRLSQGMDDAKIKSFKVPQRFLDELRASAVPENMARNFPDAPIEVDVTKAADQFGLRPQQIKELQEAIIKGSGEIK